ncbi:MAG: tRNA pseudouridine(38-40) synthase TruA [Methylococcales bacterium]
MSEGSLQLQRLVLGIEYDGSHFFGWQWQVKLRSVQEVLQQALSKVANHPVTVICAGRTDTGVHALEQVVHFDTHAERSLHSWLLGGNANLPEDVRIAWVKTGVGDFHARYSAIARFYRYVILNRPVKSALQPRQATWCVAPLDVGRMQQAAQFLVGNHDFSSFRAQGCQSKSPQRLLYFIEVSREMDRVIIDLSANAFLHHMVRNIAGVLMEIGKGLQSVEWTQYLLQVKDRKAGGVTASPCGLYLGGVYYPARYGLDKHPIFERLPVDAKRFDGGREL